MSVHARELRRLKDEPDRVLVVLAGSHRVAMSEVYRCERALRAMGAAVDVRGSSLRVDGGGCLYTATHPRALVGLRPDAVVALMVAPYPSLELREEAQRRLKGA